MRLRTSTTATTCRGITTSMTSTSRMLYAHSMQRHILCASATSLAFCGMVSSTILTPSSSAIARCTRCTKTPFPSPYNNQP